MHFCVAVIHDENTEVEDLLERYDSNIETEPRLIFTKEEAIKKAKECRENLKKELDEFNLLTEAEKEDEYKKGFGQRRFSNVLLHCDKCVNEISKNFIKANTDEEILKRYASYECLQLDQNMNIVETYNPDSKFDYYEIGGRWGNLLRLKDGTKADEAYIEEVDFTPETAADLRLWQIKVNNYPLKEGEEDPFYFGDLKAEYDTIENYQNYSQLFSTYAVVTPDGEWHDNDNWENCNSDDQRTYYKIPYWQWKRDFKSTFIDPYPNHIISIVDIHN